MFLPKQKGKFSPAATNADGLELVEKIGADVRGQHGCQFSDPSVLVFATPKHQRRNIFHHIYSDPCPARPL